MITRIIKNKQTNTAGIRAADVCPSTDQNILEVVASGNERFSNILKRLQRICPGRLCPLDTTQVETINAIENDGPMVVFVPTEEALQSLLGNINVRDIVQQPEALDELQRVLAYHVVRDGATCDGTLGQGVVETLLTGETIEVEGDDETLVDGAGHMIPVIKRMPASNGQVYLIDGILLPQNVSIAMLQGGKAPSSELS